jgi:catechol 2,3-dioxygenase-like lactoylglutathione lyase family enzyme
MSTADHVTCCCADTLAEVARLTAERDRARALAIRLEAEAAQPYLPAGPFPPPHRYPTPIIEWLASVGLDAQRIPAREPRLVRRDGGAWFLRFYEFALDADGRRILDGDGFGRWPTREVEVATLPPEPWLSDWGGDLDDLDDDAEWEARTAGRSRAASPLRPLHFDATADE